MFDQAPDKKKRTVGIAALVVVGMLAGVLVATSASGAEFATIGTIAEDNEAYALPLEDERVKFTLEAEEDAGDPVVRFAVYDPKDGFFGSFDLAGDGDDVEILTDQPGHWVIFVTQARQADLAVGLEDAAEDDNASDQLIELEVEEVEHEVATLDGEPMDEEIALRLATRPSVAFLRVDGQVTDMDATVSTDKGPVFAVEDATLNETSDGIATASGDYTLVPDNLIAGTYKVQAQAAELDGQLVLVHQTYDRGDLETIKEAPETPDVDAEAPAIAEMEEHEAALVDTQGLDVIAFELPRDARATIYLYDSNDTFVEAVEIDDEHAHGWEDNHSDENASDTRLVEHELFEAGEYVLFTSYIYAHDGDEQITVRLPGAESPAEAERLKLEETEVTFEDDEENATKSANLTDGALVGVHLRSMSDVSFEKEVTVAGPLGEILHVRENANVLGGSWYEDHAYERENLSGGTIDMTVEGGQGMNLLTGGETTVTLVSYLR